ncbi:MAG: hypothetical protein CL908_01805 [Deltaproteobacteria bacterium]|nr:hypothetical protein [Deltaproteobacteria bacterium]
MESVADDRPISVEDVLHAGLPLQFLMLVFAGWVSRHQQVVIESLREENRVLLHQMGGKRLRFTDQRRRRLAS